MEGKNLVKTDKTIKVDPEKILKIYKYVKNYINWESEEFVKKIEKIFQYEGKQEYGGSRFSVGRDLKDGIEIYVPLKFIVLPTYMRDKRFKITKYYWDLLDPRISYTVDINEFSLFDIYQVVEEPGGRLGVVDFNIEIKYRKDINSYGLTALSIVLEDKHVGSPSRFYLTGTSLSEDPYYVEKSFMYLETIKQLQGFPYADLSSLEEHSSGVLKNISEGMLWLERDLTSTLNLLNFLHNYKFDKDDVVGLLFEPYSNLVKGFGCKFEDALLLSDVISALLF